MRRAKKSANRAHATQKGGLGGATQRSVGLVGRFIYFGDRCHHRRDRDLFSVKPIGDRGRSTPLAKSSFVGRVLYLSALETCGGSQFNCDIGLSRAPVDIFAIIVCLPLLL